MKLSNNIKYISNECADNVQQLLARKYKRDHHLLFTVDHHGQLLFLPCALVLPNTEMLTVWCCRADWEMDRRLAHFYCQWLYKRTFFLHSHSYRKMLMFQIICVTCAMLQPFFWHLLTPIFLFSFHVKFKREKVPGFQKVPVGACTNMEKVQSCTKHQTVLEPNQAKHQNQRGGRVVLALLARKKVAIGAIFFSYQNSSKIFYFLSC
jgi:hypothetical protein